MIKLYENGEPRRFVRPMAEIIEMSNDVIATSGEAEQEQKTQGFDSPEDDFGTLGEDYQQ